MKQIPDPQDIGWLITLQEQQADLFRDQLLACLGDALWRELDIKVTYGNDAIIIGVFAFGETFWSIRRVIESDWLAWRVTNRLTRNPQAPEFAEWVLWYHASNGEALRTLLRYWKKDQTRKQG